MFTPFKRKPKSDKISSTSNEPLIRNNIIKDEKFFNELQSEKKSLLPDGALTREDVLKEIEKQIQKASGKSDNPFKTREDVYYQFYDSNMKLVRANVPFEEVKIGGKAFYINKRFEGGKIVIEEMFCSPDIEINLREEYDKQQTTKAQLEKINKYILTIKNKIAKGDERYALLDIEDLKEEKWRLEKILESIKYGKSAIFAYEDPYKNKKTFMLRYCNGEYKYLKVTENNYLTEENNIKFLKGYEIQKRLEEIANLRIIKNWKEILMAVFTIFIMIGVIFLLFKGLTFEEDLFDKRVATFCGDSINFLEDELEYMKDWKCSLNQATNQNTPSYNQPK